ncbi:Tn3 family transposase [Streptomyces sp. NPDC002851]
MIVGKLSASSWRNARAAALKGVRAIRRTVYAPVQYLSDESYRRKIARQLNKGESLHSLRRQLHYAREGKVTRRQPEQQNEQAWCLTVVTNAVVCWHSEYMGLAVGELRAAGREVDAEVLTHISPARSSAVNYYGSVCDTRSHQISEDSHEGRLKAGIRASVQARPRAHVRRWQRRGAKLSVQAQGRLGHREATGEGKAGRANASEPLMMPRDSRAARWRTGGGHRTWCCDAPSGPWAMDPWGWAPLVPG